MLLRLVGNEVADAEERGHGGAEAHAGDHGDAEGRVFSWLLMPGWTSYIDELFRLPGLGPWQA